MEVLMEHSSKYCQKILSLVQFLFSFVNNRILKFSLAKKAVLVTQSFMCLHDHTTQIMVKFHTKRQMVSISGIFE